MLSCYKIKKKGAAMLGRFTAIYEKGEKYYIGYCPEVPGANGQGETIEECRESLKEAIKLILQDRLEDALRGIPDDAVQETLVIE
jgi:predicted RNase H-like HicB family nuclease